MSQVSDTPLPLTIGWKEYVDFPDWQIGHVKAKIDTGARTSALDVARYELDDPSEPTRIRLELALNRRRPQRLTHVEMPVVRCTVVCSSDGARQHRPVIETSIRLGPLTRRIQLTVTDRSSMLFPILLGREALAGSFIVDVGRKYLLRG